MRALRRAACAIGAMLLLIAPARAATPVEAAAGYLLSRQLPSGEFSFEGQPADAVAETVGSLVAAGISGEPIERALRYVRAHGPARAKARAGLAGRIVLGLVAAGQDPARFGFDYVAQIEASYNPISGAYDTGLYADALAAAAILAAGRSLGDRAIEHLKLNQCDDGGFGHDEACLSKSDVDTSAMVLTVFALAKLPPSDEARTRARAYLSSVRNEDGGFPLSRGDKTNANSTGLALSAFAALGEGSDARAVRALVALQTSSGGFRFSAGERAPNDYATVQALAGLMGTGYPLRAPSEATGAVRAATPARARPVTSGAGVRSSAPAVDQPVPMAVASPESVLAVADARRDEGDSPNRSIPVVAGLLSLAGIAAAVRALARRPR